ncbi:LysR family transcriptional regulator [Paracoccus sp. 1_MG-2023]|uniref:LysR family transcriptional regulator n=1 Tax=unclassified Paracoccus (in: a-proteobacteria) TaxID=2688777 RepID=UPI001C098954|nr:MULTISPECIES: LysR family transcriptional regulator [unclassified Paracoccus (in: a-proteobacteria)]MBU2956211.1 LysR family transcriptional regulator [Paracoccus sp. C2R09]MDO6667888.1 LysR family transcriptional regulator [Paracoccus sp. 1_MG-2023]
MDWDITDIRSFLAVMDAGSISAAAARAGLSKSVISKRISDFEAAIGAALFTRHAGRITPTDAGRDLALRLRPALAQLVAATESVAAPDTRLRGRLAIAAPMSFGIRHLGPVIAAFARDHPGLEILLDYDDRHVDLRGAGFDLGLRIGQMKDSSLMMRNLCHDPRVLVASPDYLSRHGPIAAPEDLRGHEMIGYLNARLGDIWPFAGIPAPVHGRITANNGEAMRDLAIGGLGLALLPLFICHDAIRDGRLHVVLPQMRQTPLPIGVVWPPMRPMPHKTRAFIDHMVRAFAQDPPWQRDLALPGQAGDQARRAT